MGMFYDNSGTSREAWKFEYTGEELLYAAKRKLIAIDASEKAERKKMSGLMLDQKTTSTSKEVEECRREIEHFGRLREQVGVLVHEFARKRDRTFNLAIGDVTFLGLHEHTYADMERPDWIDPIGYYYG